MQAVFVCGGTGTRLRPGHVGPKSLVRLRGATLLERLLAALRPLHTSKKPPLVIVDARDKEIPRALHSLLPEASIIRQPRPDGVASALLLSESFLDDVIVAVLGDVFLEGDLPLLPNSPALVICRRADASEIQKNFGVSVREDGFVDRVVEKPADCRGLHCGIGLYVMNRAVVSVFRKVPFDPRTGERGITAGLQSAIDCGIGFQAAPFDGYYKNINSRADLLEVERRFVLSERHGAGSHR